MLPPDLTLTLLHVIDTGPRRDMDRLRERCFRPRAHHLPHEREMLETEKASAHEIMQREGRTEREIVNIAAEWKADLAVICSRAEYGEQAHLGPRSVGHVARFVLDHAPCPVLLVRPSAREQFSIAP